LQAELLQPLIGRVYNILARDAMFAPAPEFMQNNSIEIEYVSPLAKAQKTGDIQSAMRLFEMLGPLAQIDQSVVDYIDVDGMAKYLMNTLSVPATTVRGQAEVAARRQQRAEQAAAEKQRTDQLEAAEAAGNAAPALRAIQAE